MPPSYWVEALSTATVLLNILPTKTLEFSTPHLALFGKPPTYDHLRVFGCKCYPNMSATAIHKLAPRSVLCVFLGYSAHHKGYRCLDLSSNRVIISRHVIFDETAFPFAEHHGPRTPADLEFLADDSTDIVLAPIGPSHKCLPAGTPPSTSDATRAPAGPRAAVPGAPLEPPEDAEDPRTPALYVPPALRVSGTSTAPRAATRSLSSAPRAALELPDALRAGLSSSGSPVSLQAPRGPPPGFPPLRPPRPPSDFTYVYSRRQRELPAAPTAAPAGPAAAPATPTAAAAAQRGGSCSSGSQPALHGHTIEERLPDAFYLPRRASLTAAEDLP